MYLKLSCLAVLASYLTEAEKDAVMHIYESIYYYLRRKKKVMFSLSLASLSARLSVSLFMYAQ